MTEDRWQRIDAAAQRFFDAFCAGDAATIDTCLAAEFTAWHNHDDKHQSRAEHLGVLAWLQRSIADVRYEDVQRAPFGNGFLQQHVLRGRAGEEEIALFACIIGQFDEAGERLVATHEYLDSRQLAPLLRPKR